MKSSGKSLVLGLIEAFFSLQTTFKDFRIGHLLQLQHHGLIDKELAASLLRYNVDFNFFDLQIGRGLNFRIGDETSVWRRINPAETFSLIAGASRSEPSPNEISEHFSIFDCHNGLLFSEFISHAFPNSTMVNVIRSPISVIFSWVRDGLFEDFNLQKPNSQILQIRNHGGPVPLHASGWPNEFSRMRGPDRAVRIFSEIHSQEISNKKKLQQLDIKYLDLVFEDILANPIKTIETLRAFIHLDTLPSLTKILERERVPRVTEIEEHDRKLIYIRKKLSPEYQKQFDELIDAEQHD
jgi:hypothetical protein